MLKKRLLRALGILLGIISVPILIAFAAQDNTPASPVNPLVFEQRLGLPTPANPKLPSLILVGDSTVRNGYGVGIDGLWGWGAPIAELFDPTKINVVNRAIGGLSSHTYLSEGHWESTLALIKPGDFVLIQFGHNDGGLSLPGVPPIPDDGAPSNVQQSASAPVTNPAARRLRGSLPGVGEETTEVDDPHTGKHESVHTFGWYLRKYVVDTRAKGATPILCSLVPRKFWSYGHVVRNTNTYRGWTQQIATQEHTGFVDLNEIIARRYDALGPDAIDPLFGDPHTHTTLAGAQLNAECVVAGLKALSGNPLAPYFSIKGNAIKPYRQAS